MRTRLLLSLAFALPLCLLAGQGVAQKDGDGLKHKEDRKEADALFERANAFVAAFHKGDAKAVASFWTADGDYTDQTGKHLKGQAEIEKAFKKLFGENKGLKLRIDSGSLRFVTPDIAIEDGTTEVIPADGPPSRARYTVVHAKKDGKWYLASVRDAPFTPPSHYERLQPLEWLIGDWSDEAGKSNAGKGEAGHISFAWGPGQNFIVSNFLTTHKNVNLGGGTQWIGWDPLAKRIRSWSFENSGGFGEGSWTQDGKSWVIKTTAVLPDGTKASATNIVTPIDDDTLLFASKERRSGGKPMRDLTEVRMKRQK